MDSYAISSLILTWILISILCFIRVFDVRDMQIIILRIWCMSADYYVLLYHIILYILYIGEPLHR